MANPVLNSPDLSGAGSLDTPSPINFAEIISRLKAEQIERIAFKIACDTTWPPYTPTPLPQEERVKVIRNLLPPFKEILSRAFSIPLNFLQTPIRLTLLDQEGLLKMGILVPAECVVELRVDEPLSHERQSLVFCLSHQSGETAFKRSLFTIEELEKLFPDPYPISED